MKIKLNGEWLEVESVQEYDYIPMLELEDGTEWYVAEDSESAGKAAREYYQEMAKNNQSEFVCMVGENALIEWALGNSYAPGSIPVKSLEEWLDLWLDAPEEHFASYDGEEVEISKFDSDSELQDALGFIPTVAYWRS